MPTPVQGATYGLQISGTEKPSNRTALADLNPCPLNTCYDTWGFCGTTVDFYTKSPADTGAPGTVKPETNSYISNCGMEIVNNGKAPDQLKTIEYFEAFDVDISDVEYKFSRFVKISGFKKILTFSGWAFSTEADTFQRFRDTTKKEYRETFVNNLVSYMNRKNLDGFDFDWEYPSAPDIPDITSGSPEEEDNYLTFLQLLQSKLPSEKSLSLAVPASY
ncbi:hypothetical protein COH21_008116 [Aspergillus flavus]|nr:hypothetical protein COH21_008116 [Aspergillus flavus]